MKFLSTFNPFSKLEKNRSRFAFYQLRGQEIAVDSVDLETVLDPQALKNIQAEWEEACANYANDRASRNQPILSAENKAQSPDLEQKFKEEKKAIRVGYLEMVSQTLGLDVPYFLTSDVKEQVLTDELREEIRTLQSYFQIQSSADINKFLTELNQKIDTEIEKIVSLKFQQEAENEDNIKLFANQKPELANPHLAVFQSLQTQKGRIKILWETRAKLRKVFVQQAKKDAGEEISAPPEATPEMLKSGLEAAEEAFLEKIKRVQTLGRDRKEQIAEISKKWAKEKEQYENDRPSRFDEISNLIGHNLEAYFPLCVIKYINAEEPTLEQISSASNFFQNSKNPLTSLAEKEWLDEQILLTIEYHIEERAQEEIAEDIKRIKERYEPEIKLARKEISAAYARKQALEVELIQRQDPSWQIEQIREKSLFSESNSEIKPDLLAQIEAEFREEIQTQIAAATADQTPEIQ